MGLPLCDVDWSPPPIRAVAAAPGRWSRRRKGGGYTQPPPHCRNSWCWCLAIVPCEQLDLDKFPMTSSMQQELCCHSCPELPV